MKITFLLQPMSFSSPAREYLPAVSSGGQLQGAVLDFYHDRLRNDISFSSTVVAQTVNFTKLFFNSGLPLEPNLEMPYLPTRTGQFWRLTGTLVFVFTAAGDSPPADLTGVNFLVTTTPNISDEAFVFIQFTDQKFVPATNKIRYVLPVDVTFAVPPRNGYQANNNVWPHLDMRLRLPGVAPPSVLTAKLERDVTVLNLTRYQNVNLKEMHEDWSFIIN